MSAEGGNRAVIAALSANLGIAATKLVAFALTQSSSMLAESVHSVADSGNQLLLLLGGRRAKQAATDEHPFGYGRARYFYAFIVAVVLFAVGGLFALFEAWSKWQAPHPIEGWRWVPPAVLGVAITLEATPCAPRCSRRTGSGGRRAGSRSSAPPRHPSCRSSCSRTSARSSGALA